MERYAVDKGGNDYQLLSVISRRILTFIYFVRSTPYEVGIIILLLDGCFKCEISNCSIGIIGKAIGTQPRKFAKSEFQLSFGDPAFQRGLQLP